MANPAEKLYWHLHNLTAVDGNRLSWPSAWEEVLSAKWTDSVGPLLGLLASTEQILAAHPEIAPGAVLHHREEWQRAILLYGVNLDQTIVHSGFQLTTSSNYALYTLAMLIKQLPEVSSDLAIDQLKNLAEAVAELREAVETADELKADLRTFLLVQVSKMQDRISRAHITGSGPVEDLVAETIGSGAVHSSMWRRAMDSSLRDKVVGVFMAFQTIVGVVDTTTAAIESSASHVEGAVTIVEQIFADPPKQLESAKPPLELESGPNEPAHPSPGEPVK